jgi:hypothetical protein
MKRRLLNDELQDSEDTQTAVSLFKNFLSSSPLLRELIFSRPLKN